MKVIQIDCHSMQHEVVADVPFNSAYIDHNGITEDESTYIPYNDNALREAVQPLMWDIAKDNEWAFPDYDTAKTMLVVNTDGQQPRIQLLIEVEPPRYTEQEEADILSHVSGDTYDMWRSIFDTAWRYHNGNGTMGYSGDTMEIYDMELEPDEMQCILSIVNCFVRS